MKFPLNISKLLWSSGPVDSGSARLCHINLLIRTVTFFFLNLFIKLNPSCTEPPSTNFSPFILVLYSLFFLPSMSFCVFRTHAYEYSSIFFLGRDSTMPLGDDLEPDIESCVKYKNIRCIKWHSIIYIAYLLFKVFCKYKNLTIIIVLSMYINYSSIFLIEISLRWNWIAQMQKNSKFRRLVSFTQVLHKFHSRR